MKVSRPLLISLIVALAAFLGLVFYDEVRRREAAVKEYLQTNETLAQTSLTASATTEPSLQPMPPITSDALEPRAEAVSTQTLLTESIPITPSTALNPEITSSEVNTPNSAVNAQASQNNPASTSESDAAPTPPETQTTPETSEGEVPICSSFDQAGLLAIFDASLAAFIANATATYGSQYSDLQYELSSKTATITGKGGTVTTSYSGTVQELSTGEAVSANGVITANFAWDGCVWQLVNYSF